MKNIPRLYHSILLLLFVFASAACGRSDAPITSDVAPGVYPPPPTVDPIYPEPEDRDPNAYPAPRPWSTSTPLPTVEMPPAPAADFAFVFEFSWCNPDIVDTFNHTYTQNILTETWATTPLTLTDTEMTAIYQKMVEVNFFAYPEQYQPQAADGRGVSAPALHYRFTVQNNTHTKVVDWIDASPNPPSNEETRRLKELGDFIIVVTLAHPDVTALPERQVACL